MKLAIIGTGYVGLTTGTCFAEKGHEVVCVDNNELKIKNLQKGIIPIYEPKLEELVNQNMGAKRLSFTTSIKDAVESSDVIFIAVPTPPQPDGSVDLSFVEQVSREIAACFTLQTSYKVIVDKSTVPVRTGDNVMRTIATYACEGADFDVVSNPEFLREGCAVDDLLYPDRIVVGVSSPRAGSVMNRVYEGFDAPLIETDINSAELIKHAANSFLALKISYINAVSAICEATNADIKKVAKGIGLDDRIGCSFLNAGLGYGGSCFPKDIKAFIAISEQLGIPFRLLKEVEAINESQRKRFFGKICQRLWILKDKNIAVWGLAFKQNTDDIRESVAIKLCGELLAAGVNLKVYDPQALENAKEYGGLEGNIEYCTSMEECLHKADALVIATEWPEFANFNLDVIKKTMRSPLVFDGRNLFKRINMVAAGIEYHCIGRPNINEK